MQPFTVTLPTVTLPDGTVLVVRLENVENSDPTRMTLVFVATPPVQ